MTRFALRVALALSFFVACGASAMATVIPDDVTLSATPGGVFGDYQLELGTSIPDGGGWFGVGITAVGPREFAFGSFAIAEQYAMYPGESLTVFGPAEAASAPIVTSNAGPDSSTVIIGAGLTALFTYWDDRDFSNDPTAGDNYGWVELRNGAAGLELIGSATAIGSGILVGTTIAVPEPATIAGVVFAIAAVLRRR